jgi:hypothetical protein
MQREMSLVNGQEKAKEQKFLRRDTAGSQITTRPGLGQQQGEEDFYAERKGAY